MPVSNEILKQDLDHLTQEQLQQVADFIAFLKFQHKQRSRLVLNPIQLAALANEFEEDRALAEAGINDYAVMLEREDLND